MNDIIYGRRPVIEAFQSKKRRIVKLWLARGVVHSAAFEKIIKFAGEEGVHYQWVDNKRLRELSGGGNHQGVIARVSSFSYGNLNDLLSLSPPLPSPIAILDGIEDPQNLGAIIRSAAFFSIKFVIIPRWRAAALTDIVEKVSSGGLEYVTLVQVANLANTITKLKDKGYWIMGTGADGRPVNDIDIPGPVCVVIGAEGRGMHRLVQESCDLIVKIPGTGKIDSLNASCAASILFFKLSGLSSQNSANVCF